jgi:hypothetical protein
MPIAQPQGGREVRKKLKNNIKNACFIAVLIAIANHPVRGRIKPLKICVEIVNCMCMQQTSPSRAFLHPKRPEGKNSATDTLCESDRHSLFLSFFPHIPRAMELSR